eukprot:1548386-Alexandrium_andersonii.AAC.1
MCIRDSLAAVLCCLETATLTPVAQRASTPEQRHLAARSNSTHPDSVDLYRQLSGNRPHSAATS